MTRYVFETNVINVEEKFCTVRGRMVDGQKVVDTESMGWFIRLTESSAICVGSEKPNIVAGDKVRFTLEKIGG